MDAATLGAALAIAKSIPNTAVGDATAAANRAEAAAQSVEYSAAQIGLFQGLGLTVQDGKIVVILQIRAAAPAPLAAPALSSFPDSPAAPYPPPVRPVGYGVSPKIQINKGRRLRVFLRDRRLLPILFALLRKGSFRLVKKEEPQEPPCLPFRGQRPLLLQHG